MKSANTVGIFDKDIEVFRLRRYKKCLKGGRLQELVM